MKPSHKSSATSNNQPSAAVATSHPELQALGIPLREHEPPIDDLSTAELYQRAFDAGPGGQYADPAGDVLARLAERLNVLTFGFTRESGGRECIDITAALVDLAEQLKLARELHRRQRAALREALARIDAT